MEWWQAILGLVLGLAIIWLIFIVVLLVFRPTRSVVKQALRFVPDLVRFVGRLSRDKQIPVSKRLLLLVLVAYLASPVDVVPDFIPILGYADDAIVIVLVLRQLLKTVDDGILSRHWPGGPEGLVILRRLCGLEAR